MEQVATAGKLLIVDDSKVSRMRIRAFFSAQCPAWDIQEAGTGDEAAVQWLREHPLPQYQPFTEMPVPEFLAEQSIAIHMQAAKQAPAPEPAPAAEAKPTEPEKAKP